MAMALLTLTELFHFQPN